MAILNLLLPVFFFIFSPGELARFGLGQGASLGIIDFVISAVVLVWFFKIKKNKYFLSKPIGGFIIVALFSLLINLNNFPRNELFVSSLYLVRFILYSLLYFVFTDIGKKFDKKILRYLTISGIIILLIGFAQFFFYPSLRNLYYLGWDEHFSRLFSTFLDPNFTGVILVLFFVFVFIFKEKLFTNKKYSFVILLATFLGIVLTYSRGALLMFLVCALSYSIITKNRKIILSTIGTFILLFIILSPRFYLENNNLLRMVSTRERIETSRNALAIFQKNPLGVGFDTYRYAREKYGDLDKSKFGPSHSGAGVDNSLVLVLVTTGVQGLFVYVYLLYRIFRLGKDNVKKNKYALVLVISLPGLIINSLFINSLFYSFVMIWIWVLAGLTESNSRE